MNRFQLVIESYKQMLESNSKDIDREYIRAEIKALEINIGINSFPVFINEIDIEYCPMCGHKL